MVPLRIYKDANEVEHRLRGLGLRTATLTTAIQRGHLARIECTENHPVTAPGFYCWSETVRAMRELMAQDGWIRDNEGNQGLIRNAELDLTLTVAAGDEGVGLADRIPTTRYPKGPRMSAAVLMNGYLFEELEKDYEALAACKSIWLLLYHWDPRRQRVRCELSKPSGMDESRPSEWLERIILPHVDTDFPRQGAKPDSGGPKTPEIRIEIKRRA